MLIFWSEISCNAVKKAKGSVWLRKQQVDVLPLHSIVVHYYVANMGGSPGELSEELVT